MKYYVSLVRQMAPVYKWSEKGSEKALSEHYVSSGISSASTEISHITEGH